MLKMALLDCSINEKLVEVLMEDRELALFFLSLFDRDLTAAQESPPPGVCHPRQKNTFRGSARGARLGAAGID